MRSVPLVTYEGGNRKVIGVASIDPAGKVSCEIKDVEFQKSLEDILAEFSVGFTPSPPPLMPINKFCTACQINMCGRGKDDRDCFCCQTDHI